MTQVIVLGNDKPKEELEPIKFIEKVSSDLTFKESKMKPKDYNYIELVCKEYNSTSVDLLFAYNDPNNRSLGVLYIGRFNDGIVK